MCYHVLHKHFSTDSTGVVNMVNLVFRYDQQKGFRVCIQTEIMATDSDTL